MFRCTLLICFLIIIAVSLTSCLMEEKEADETTNIKILLSSLKGYYTIENQTNYGVWYLTVDKHQLQSVLPEQEHFILETENTAYPFQQHKIRDNLLMLLLPEGMAKTAIENAAIKTAFQSQRNVFSNQNRKINDIIIRKEPAENGTSFFKLTLSDYLQLKADNSSFIYDSLKLIRPTYLITDEGSCYAMKTYLNARQACDTHDVDGAVSFLKGRDNPESYMYFGNPNRISVKQGGGINKSPPDDRKRLRNLGSCGALNEDHLYNIETDQSNNCFRITINREKLPSEYSSKIVFSTFLMEATECLFNETNDISILEATLSYDTSSSTEMIKNARFDGFTFALYDSDSTKKGHYSTLSNAVYAAVDDDKISVGSSETILETQQIVVQDKAITIQSVNDNPFILDYSGSATRSLLITENASLSLKNVIIQNCQHDENGAAIMNVGVLYLNSATLTNNITTKDGSGIYNGGECVVMNSEISHNQAARGAGIYVQNVSSASPRASGITIIQQNLIKNNTADSGGGVYVEANQNPLIVENTFKSNTASLKGGGIYVAEGGTVQNTNGIKWQAHQLPGTTDDAKVMEGVSLINTYTLNSISGNTAAIAAQVYYTRTDDSHLTDWVAHDRLNQIILAGTFSVGDIMRVFDSSDADTEIASTTYTSGGNMRINRDITSASVYYVSLQDVPTSVYAQAEKRKALILSTPATPPGLLSPANGAINLQRPVTMTWKTGIGEETFNFYFGTDPNALPLIGNFPRTTLQYTHNSLAANTTYYWKVEGVDRHGATNSSPVYSFKTFVFEGGDGSQGNPYQVKNAGQLDAVRNYLSSHFVQTGNINLSSYSRWNPISTFSGTYDGQNYSISNLKIITSGDNIGLFGYTSGATLKNMNLTGVFIRQNGHSSKDCGALAGNANKTTITNCHSSGTVDSQGDNVGGLVGYYQSNSSVYYITESHSSCSVTGRYDGGGLVGTMLNYVSVRKSYATGNVTTDNCAGGLVGLFDGAEKVEDCYARGNVKATYYQSSSGDFNGMVGGLIGRNNAGTLVKNSYSTGKVTYDYNGSKGGLIGRNVSPVTNCYWDTQTSRISSSAGGGTGLTTSGMKNSSNYSGWNFSSIWRIDGYNNGYPRLRNNYH